MPLNDLLEAYGPDILAGVSEDSWGAVTGTDGNIYGLPVRYPYSKEVSCFILCRMDLMREAGVDEVPTTIDEFYEALVKIKEHFGDEYIPFAGPLINVGASNGTGGLQAFAISGSIASAFGIYNDWMVNDDGEVIYMTEAPGYADMVTFMNKLYTEGLLDPDYAVNTNTTLREKFSGEKAVMICANRGTVTSVTALMENNPDGHGEAGAAAYGQTVPPFPNSTDAVFPAPQSGSAAAFPAIPFWAYWLSPCVDLYISIHDFCTGSYPVIFLKESSAKS